MIDCYTVNLLTFKPIHSADITAIVIIKVNKAADTVDATIIVAVLLSKISTDTFILIMCMLKLHIIKYIL